MVGPSERWVPKGYPRARGTEQDDPFELYATPVIGDPEVMLRCLVQEYAWMGWNADAIFALFGNPDYPALNGLLQVYGHRAIRSRIDSILTETGVFRFEGYVREDPEPETEELELVELGMPLSWGAGSPEGVSNA